MEGGYLILNHTRSTWCHVVDNGAFLEATAASIHVPGFQASHTLMVAVNRNAGRVNQVRCGE
jgi:hypothetical protein